MPEEFHTIPDQFLKSFHSYMHIVQNSNRIKSHHKTSCKDTAYFQQAVLGFIIIYETQTQSNSTLWLQKVTREGGRNWKSFTILAPLRSTFPEESDAC